MLILSWSAMDGRPGTIGAVSSCADKHHAGRRLVPSGGAAAAQRLPELPVLIDPRARLAKCRLVGRALTRDPRSRSGPQPVRRGRLAEIG